MFPGINFVLLDSDCLPITLFEVEDLWTEAYLARFPVHSNSGIPRAHSLRAFKRFCNDPKVVDTQQQVGSTRMGQGALVVTEPHAELNAGLIVIFRSSHPPIFFVGPGVGFPSSPYPALLARSRSRSPPFRPVRGRSILFCLPLSHLVTVISPLLSFF